MINARGDDTDGPIDQPARPEVDNSIVFSQMSTTALMAPSGFQAKLNMPFFSDSRIVTFVIYHELVC